MDKTTSDTLFHINQIFNFVEPINNPVRLTIGDTLYNVYVYSGYKIVVDNTVASQSVDYRDFLSFYDFVQQEANK